MFNEQGLLSSRVFVKNSTLADSREESAARADERRSAEHFDKGANSYAAGYGERSSSGHSFPRAAPKRKLFWVQVPWATYWT